MAREHLYKAILDVSPHALLVVDDKLKVLLCNQSCEKLFARPKEKIVGKRLFELLPHKDLERQIKSSLEHQDVGTKLVEINLDAQKREQKILRVTISNLCRENFGKPSCVITLEDITKQVQFEQQLIESEKLAGMGLLARSIVHELGNPLSIMKSTLQYIKEITQDTKDENLKETIEIFIESVHQMHTLLRSLSDFSSSRRLHFKPQSIPNIILKLLTLIEKEAKAHNIHIKREFEEDIPECEVDGEQIRHLFLNLLKNAIEAMPQGGELFVKVGRFLKDLFDEENKIYVQISDTGEGIEADQIQYIFRPFYSTKPRGTGLGLFFCRHVVEDHGGKILVESEVGKGTTFTVILPVKQTREQYYE